MTGRKRRLLVELEGEEADDYLRDLPINGEGSDGIQYDYYLKDVSIVFPEIEEDRAKEPPNDPSAPAEEDLVDLAAAAEAPEKENEKEASSETGTDVQAPSPKEEKNDPSHEEGA